MGKFCSHNLEWRRRSWEVPAGSDVSSAAWSAGKMAECLAAQRVDKTAAMKVACLVLERAVMTASPLAACSVVEMDARKAA